MSHHTESDHQDEDEDHQPIDGEEEDDMIYLDDEELEAMDQDDDMSDFQTINESEIGDGTQY